MFSRLRSMSGTKLKSPSNENLPSIPAQPPSKEDILNTLDGFGEKIQGKYVCSHIKCGEYFLMEWFVCPYTLKKNTPIGKEKEQALVYETFYIVTVT